MTQVAPLLTVGQAVDRLAAAGVEVTPETVRSWARTKKIPHRRLPSGRYLFRADDLDALLEVAA
jgi:hypothetical protein